jgi:protein tyrosine/serine phosphatase
MSSSASSSSAPRRRIALIALLVTAVITSGAVFWHKVIREQIFPKNFGVVEAGDIYRSGQLTERAMRKVINENGIKTIIALNGPDEEGVMEQRVANELGVRRITFALAGDGTGPPADFAAAVHAMADEDNWPVLVHCHAGAQRTTTAVLLYRHIYQGESIFKTYPEHFEFRHEPGDWPVLAYLAEYIDDIKLELERLEAVEVASDDPEPQPVN